jgi:hypothetical protein
MSALKCFNFGAVQISDFQIREAQPILLSDSNNFAFTTETKENNIKNASNYKILFHN